MTTNTYSTAFGHTSDADFRAWGSALAASMQTCGLVQTSDTGQINWASVTRPGTNTAGGFEIYRFNDSLQGTFPIFIKLEYGTGTGATVPSIWITVGTGSNGSGTITGQSSTRNTATSTAAPGSTVTAYPTYVCVKDGFLGVIWKAGSVASPQAHGFFTVCRTTDDAGAETGDGFTVYRRGTLASASGSATAQAVSVSNATTFAASTAYGIVHHGVTSSSVGSDKQVYKCYTIQPRVRPTLQMAMGIVSEFVLGTSVSVTLVGATPRTYLSGGDATAYAGAQVLSSYCNMMLWE